MDHSVVADALAASRLLVLKALAPDLAEMAAQEAALAAELSRLGARATKAAIDASARAAPGATPERVVDAARQAYESEFNGEAVKLLRAALESFYRLGKSAATAKATGRQPGTLRYDFAIQKADKPASVGIGFGVEDEAAIAAMRQHQAFWVGQHFDSVLSARIARVAQDAILAEGRGGVEVGALIRERLRDVLNVAPDDAIPPGFTGTPQRYFQNLAANTATTGRVFGSVQAFRELRVREIEVVNPIDERTCSRCSRMDGKVFTVETAVGQMGRVLGSANPAGVRGAQPWLTESQFASRIPTGKGTAGDNAALATAHGICLPPYHFGCRCTIDVTEGTRVERGPFTS